MARIPKPGRRRREARSLFRELDELTTANRTAADPQKERRLLRVRHRAFEHLKPANGAHEVAPAEGVEHRLEQGLPVADAAELSAGQVRAAILDHGSLHVRGLIDTELVERLKAGIDHTFDASVAYGESQENGGEDAWSGQPEAAWYQPFRPLPGYSLGGGRNWNRNNTAIWAADSPRLMFELIESFDRLGLSDLVGTYLGERPAISMNKTVLRRVPPRGGGADWHQDGAFLGDDIRSLNVWLSLSDCGVTAPGMDIVARRLDEIVPTGTDGANFDWSVAPDVAERAAGAAGIVRPHFQPGDALLFDHLNLHRTAAEETMTDPRYAVETWFFAPSSYPDGQVPIVL
ncbi:MAG TPA: phytanoyl-CoA dioxygenase family protein [Solirubrobacterales bacterium]|nr:phytanoyl-CoA dioxygenase family protein [Solirubrobacterales bacterium]